MNILTHEQMNEILIEKLASDYPEECVETGENWELIAEIFYKAGFEAALYGKVGHQIEERKFDDTRSNGT